MCFKIEFKKQPVNEGKDLKVSYSIACPDLEPEPKPYVAIHIFNDIGTENEERQDSHINDYIKLNAKDWKDSGFNTDWSKEAK